MYDLHDTFRYVKKYTYNIYIYIIGVLAHLATIITRKHSYIGPKLNEARLLGGR